MKIDPTDYLDINGHFYTAKADGFIHYPLVELAGEKHLAKVDEFVYYYNFKANPRNKHADQKQLCSIAIKFLPPYFPLLNLNTESKRVTDFKLPDNLMQNYLKFMKEGNMTNIIRVRPDEGKDN